MTDFSIYACCYTVHRTMAAAQRAGAAAAAGVSPATHRVGFSVL